MVEGLSPHAEKPLLPQVPKADGAPRAEGIILVHAEQDRIGLHRAIFKMIEQISLRRSDQRKSTAVFLNIAFNIGIRHLVDVQINLRILLPIGKEGVGVQHAEEQRAAGQAQRAALPGQKLLRLALQPAEAPDQRRKALRKVLALRREHAPGGAARKQPASELFLQLADAAAQSLLGDVELLRSLREGFVPAGLNEILDVLQFHRCPPPCLL